MFDYTGALFPEGLNPEQVYYFKHEDIDDIVFKGYSDIDEERFVKLYKKNRIIYNGVIVLSQRVFQ